jgi:hypothetical protein
METITYQCDRCKEESVNKDVLGLQWVSVGVQSTRGCSFSGVYLVDLQHREKQWCKKCLQNTGLVLLPSIEKKVLPDDFPSLEGMIKLIKDCFTEWKMYNKEQ